MVAKNRSSGEKEQSKTGVAFFTLQSNCHFCVCLFVQVASGVSNLLHAHTHIIVTLVRTMVSHSCIRCTPHKNNTMFTFTLIFTYIFTPLSRSHIFTHHIRITFIYFHTFSHIFTHLHIRLCLHLRDVPCTPIAWSLDHRGADVCHWRSTRDTRYRSPGGE